MRSKILVPQFGFCNIHVVMQTHDGNSGGKRSPPQSSLEVKQINFTPKIVEIYLGYQVLQVVNI